jgi:hypothetical protein
MRHSTVARNRVVPKRSRGRERITVLSGLPVLIRTAVVVTVAAVVGVAALCQIGILAPQFRVNGSGSSFGLVPKGAPPGMLVPGIAPPIPVFPTSSHVGWVVLENVSWRGWEVTSIEAPRQDLEISVFLEPARRSSPDYTARLVAAAATPSLTHLPLMVPRGGRLVVLATGRPGTCVATAFFQRPQRKAQAAVRVSAPFGPRSIDASMFLDPACDLDR